MSEFYRGTDRISAMPYLRSRNLEIFVPSFTNEKASGTTNIAEVWIVIYGNLWIVFVLKWSPLQFFHLTSKDLAKTRRNSEIKQFEWSKCKPKQPHLGCKSVSLNLQTNIYSEQLVQKLFTRQSLDLKNQTHNHHVNQTVINYFASLITANKVELKPKSAF